MNDILLKLEGFQFATPLDLNMGYNHIQLSENASKICTIILLWGKYRYKSLPMGVANRPDIFQHKMNDLFHGFEFIRAYIDDLLILTKRNFKQTQVEQDDFDEIKRIVARDNLFTYPDFNETFKIHTNVSALQFGSVTSQKVKPIYF